MVLQKKLNDDKVVLEVLLLGYNPSNTPLAPCMIDNFNVQTLDTSWTFQKSISMPRATGDMENCPGLVISLLNMQKSWACVAHLQNQPWQNFQMGKAERYRKSTLLSFLQM